jgi:hypothetical protein
MSLENWKLWLVPFCVWGLVMAWYTGYQSGYQDGHQTAWSMSRPSVILDPDGKLVLDQERRDYPDAELVRK